MPATGGRPAASPGVRVKRPWTDAADQVAAALGTDPSGGLPTGEATRRLELFGRNELVERARKPAWRLLAEQFGNTMIVVLLVAAGITAAIGDLKDTLVILAIVILNGLVGFAQEYRAEQAMAALKAMAAPNVRVRRAGQVRQVPAAELVPGDVVLLGQGDLIAADLRLTEAWALRVNEAALTGESEPVDKHTEPLPQVDDQLPAERRNMAFRGTAVTGGRGVGVVVATGMATELGRLAELLQAHPAAPTPLQRRLAVLGRRLAAWAFLVCAVVFVAGVARGEPVERMFLTAVSLAVAAIPEGLPAVVTIALALGARRMARRRALVRKLPAVETLGSVTVICSDKTGTLTQNRMLVERVWTPAGTCRVAGDGYAPSGSIEPDGEAGPAAGDWLDRLAAAAAACNDASLRPPDATAGQWSVSGDPTEAGLLALAGKRGITREGLERQRPRVAEVAFDAARRRMTTLHRVPDGVWAATKGAVDALVPLLRSADAALAEEALAVAALVERVAATPVYARTSPEQKLRIVTAWKAREAVVAMTGDGVNDAPALRRADIGVAMGVAGTDVSREAADMVLADDDFATIVAAVEEGRRIYDNIRRFVRYLLTTNSGEIWVMFLAAVSLGLLVGARAAGWPWQTMVFTTLALLQLGHALAVRSERDSFFTLGARSNPLLLAAVLGGLSAQLAIVYVPVLQRLFDTRALGPAQLAVVLVASTVAFVAVEIEKWLGRRHGRLT